MKSQRQQFHDADMVIYYNYWKYIAILITGVGLTAGTILILINDDEYSPSSRITVGLCATIMGIGGLCVLLDFLYRTLCNIPVIAIYPDRVVFIAMLKRRILIFYFRDVECFSIRKIESTKFIAVHYKKQVLKNKQRKASKAKNWLFSFNLFFSGAIEALPASTLTIKGDKLCDILNIYLQEFDKNNIASSAAPPAK